VSARPTILAGATHALPCCNTVAGTKRARRCLAPTSRHTVRPVPNDGTDGRHGFTLLELLAALAIASVIIAATGALVRNVAHYFDRGTRAVSDGERLVLAIERVAADIGSARFITTTSQGRIGTAFVGEPTTVTFVGAGGVSSSQKGEHVVTLTAEQEDDITRLVRRSGTWPGPRARIEDVALGEPVILLEGKILISFAFGRLDNRGLAWSDTWKGEAVPPRFVRLTLRDRATGADLLAATDFVIRADASGSCAQNDAPICVAPSTGPTNPRGNQ
jgi:prepilin-type N-terminal cleavage/methylation domain-containing protein